MSDGSNDADKIRLKRLEKLQQAQQRQQEQQQAQSPSNTSTSSSTNVARTPAGSVSAASTSNIPAANGSTSSAESKVAVPSVPTKKPSIASSANSSSITSKAPRTISSVTPRTSTPTPPSASTSALGATSQQPQIPYPQWLSGTISRILQVTLSQSRAEAANWSVTYLWELHNELVAEAEGSETEATVRFDEDNVERAIVARLSMDPEQMSDSDEDPIALTVLAGLPPKMTNLEYLVGCWKRWSAEKTRLGTPNQSQPEAKKRSEALEMIKRKIIEGIGLQLQEPELFPQPSEKVLGGAELVPVLLHLPSHPSSPNLQLEQHQIINLLSDLAAVYATPASSEDLVDILGTPVLQKLIDKLGAKQGSIQAMLAAMNAAPQAGQGVMDFTGSDWRAVVRAVNDAAEVKAISNMFVEMPNWLPTEAPPNTFEVESLIGPILRLGCFYDGFPSVAKAYFAQPSALSREAAEASSNALRSSLNSHHGLLFSLFNSIVRSSAASREGILAFFSHIIKINNKRAGMQVDRRTVSTDGFMINSLSVLMDFCKPFMDASYSKIDKIDPEYFRKCRGRIDMQDATKIHATAEEAKEYYNNYEVNADLPAPNFISEIFFLATSFMHYGLYPAIQYHEALYRHLRNLREDHQEAENNRQYDGTPQEAAYRQQVERMKANVDSLHSRIYAAEVQLLDPLFIARTADFCSFVMSWLVRLVDPRGKHPVEQISLDNLPTEAPLAFRMLPEYILEDVTEFYFFISRYAPITMIDMQKDQLLVFIIVFLCTSYVNNPYLKGKFVEILYRNTRSWGSRFPRGVLGDTINYNPLALKGLLPALMKIYCQIEFTGQHNQFYEKFEVRHQIAKVLKLIWETKEHREAFKAESGKEDFVRFVNYLLNDTTFLLDESLSKLKLIHDIQQEMADKESWEAMPEEQRKDREKLFKSSEGQATSFLIYTYEVLHLLKTLTAEAPEPFLRGEIVDRLAASLDFNLNVLAGPRCQELRVQDREKYKFRPRDLLGDIMQIILNLADQDRYITATAKDGRSYSRSLFENAMRIAGRAALKTEMQLQPLRHMVSEIEALKAAEEEEEEMEETPDEYLDPLTAEIMLDPVVLPTSGTIIDFNTIKQHLLTVQQDPFNRSPLNIEDVKRDDKLRIDIENFKEQRRQDRLNRIQAARHAEEEAQPATEIIEDAVMEA